MARCGSPWLSRGVATAIAQFALALMPGETHECYGFAKFYNMTQMAVDRGPEVIDAVGNFIQYFAGEVDGSRDA